MINTGRNSQREYADIVTTNRNKPVIGLTGGIGAGKSSVAQLMQDQGCAVINADQLAQNALKAPNVRAQIVDRWGDNVLNESGEISRAALAAIVFNDSQALDILEKIIHPLVDIARHELRRAHQTNPQVRAIVEDCPLLLEKQVDRECDVIVFVDSPRYLRLMRVASERGWSEQDLVDREKNQLGLDFKAQKADYVLVNNADESKLTEQVRGVLSQII